MKALKSLQKTNTSNLYQRGSSGIWYADFSYEGVTVRQSTRTSEIDLAQKWIEAKKRMIWEDIHNPKPITARCITLAKAIDNTYHDKWALGRSDLAASNSYHQATTCKEILGDIPLNRLSTESLRNLRRSLRTRKYQGKIITETTVNKYVTALRTIYNHHQDEYKLPNLKWDIKKKGVENKRITIFSQEEQQKIDTWFRQHNQDTMADLCMFLCTTGLRLSECIGIGVSNEKGHLISEIDLEKQKIHAWITKNGEPRALPLEGNALTIAKARGNKPFPFNKDYAEYLWGKMKKALGLPKEYLLHCYRHTCASQLAASGSSREVVQKWLGHTDYATTAIYIHLFPDELENAARRMSDQFNR